jgi:hypothetical protein
MFPLNYSDPLNPDGLVLTSHKVMDEAWPILLVTHDAEDGAWQFVNGWGDTENPDDAMFIHVEHVIERDPSVMSLVDLPLGWRAWRQTIDDDWNREPHPGHD